MNEPILRFNDINDILQDAYKNVTDSKIENVLNKIDSFLPLNDFDVGILLYADTKYQDIILEKAKKINKLLYDKVIKFYGVSYVSDFCLETCRYCGDNLYSNRTEWERMIRSKNDTKNLSFPRHFLSPRDLKRDIEALLKKHPGLEQICLLSGDTPTLNTERWIASISEVIKIYNKKIILNIPPLDITEFRKIRNAFPNVIFQFRVFQETYDEKIYRREHPYYNFKDQRTLKSMNAFLKEKRYNSAKADFWARVYSQERAIIAGFDEYGIGALFGLNDGPHGSFFEVLAFKRHAEYMHIKYGLWPQTISFPRILPSKGIDYKVPKPVNDLDFERIIAVTKIAIPQSELIITCRENAEFRRKVRPIINIEDYEARPGPGGNMSDDIIYQMEIVDRRSGQEIKKEMEKDGYKTI